MMGRVRVGLMGLASVFLLVMLSAAILHVASDAPKGGNAAADANAGLEAPNEPLAQLGVAPGTPQDAAPAPVAPATARTARR